MSNLYLYGLPDGKVYREQAGALVEVADQPVTEGMFASWGDTELSLTLISSTPLITIYQHTAEEASCGSKLNATAVYIGKTAVQVESFTIPEISQVILSPTSLPANSIFKVLFSIDEGLTWLKHDGSLWVEASLDNIGEEGLTYYNVAALGKIYWVDLMADSSLLRIAYYLEQSTAADRIQIEKIRINFN